MEKKSTDFDREVLKKHWDQKYSLYFCGVDEVGRGPLAGPVVAATVGLKIEAGTEKQLLKLLSYFKKNSITDSKKLSSQKRKLILKQIGIDFEKISPLKTYSTSMAGFSVSYSICEIDNRTIDKINILNSSLLAMKMSEENVLSCLNPEKSSKIITLVDGNRLWKVENDSSEVLRIPKVKGDSKYSLISLASIIAKEYRDNLMSEWAVQYPHYQWEKNSGYPTKEHLAALKKFGPCPFHRRTFRGVSEFYVETKKGDAAGVATL